MKLKLRSKSKYEDSYYPVVERRLRDSPVSNREKFFKSLREETEGNVNGWQGWRPFHEGDARVTATIFYAPDGHISTMIEHPNNG